MASNILSKEHILDALKLDFLPEDNRIDVLDAMVENINERMLLKIFESLNPADQKSFSALLDSGNAAKTDAFVNEKIPNFLSILAHEIDQVKAKAQSYAV